MSFRLRVLALITLVALTATGATAWITLRQASRQVTETATADQRVVRDIVAELTQYGRDHLGWDGVGDVIAAAATRTGQRIQVSSSSGVLADSDVLAGRSARPTVTPGVLIDPRPNLPKGLFGRPSPAALVQKEILSYRWDVALATCMRDAGLPPVAMLAVDGTTRYWVDKSSTAIKRCSVVSDKANPEAVIKATAQALTLCHAPEIGISPAERQCLERTFAEQLANLAAQPVQVRIGVADTPPAGIAAGPIVLAASIVAVVVLLGALLLSRRVLRPIGALTAASSRLGAGDLAQRVPALGGDELGRLGRAFNDMAERLERSEAQQRQLVADVAHELRTPLANLRGYLEALKDGVITGDATLFASLHEEAVLQHRIVDDLQDLALAESGQLAYHRAPVDAGVLIESSVAAHQAAAEAAGIALTALADPVIVVADPDRLRQAIGNLLRNAVAATAAGGRIEARVWAEPREAVVEIVDTGRGIAAAELSRVFDRFWRADHSRARASGGAGLGLAIVRQIVTDHSGTISVASQLGVGTTFTIRLPINAAD